MDIDQVQEGEYELVAELFDQPLSKPGEPFNFKRYVRGDKVTLNVEEARRLYSAGAVVEPGSIERARVSALKVAYEAALAALPPDPTPAEPVANEPPFPAGEPVDSWTIEQLRAYGAAKQADLKGLTAKADILKAVQA